MKLLETLTVILAISIVILVSGLTPETVTEVRVPNGYIKTK